MLQNTKTLFSHPVLWLFLSISALQAQSTNTIINGEVGLPFIKNYDIDITGVNERISGVVQDQRGFTYAVSDAGLLEYDGVNWRLITLPEGVVAQDLDIDKRQRIFIIGYREIGYLVADHWGKWQYISLTEHIPEPYRDFKELFNVYCTAQGVFFCTRHYLFRWREQAVADPAAGNLPAGELKVWETDSGRFDVFYVEEEIYFNQRDIGWGKITGDSLVLFTGPAAYHTRNMRFIFPLSGSTPAEPKLLIGGNVPPLQIYDGKDTRPFAVQPEITDYLGQYRLLRSQRLQSGQFFLSTVNDGALVMDQSGNWRRPLNTNIGLQSQLIYDLFEDQRQRLWLATDKGVSYVRLSSPLAYYPEALGYEATPADICRHQGSFYVGTNRGLYKLMPAISLTQPPSFRKLPGIDAALRFEPVGDDLMVAGADTIFLLSDDQVRPISGTLPRPQVLLQSPYREDLVFFGSLSGVGVIRKWQGRWQVIGYLAGIEDNIYELEEDVPGHIRASGFSDYLFQITIPESSYALIDAPPVKRSEPLQIPVEIQRLGEEAGIEAGSSLGPASEDHFVHMGFRGLKRFDPASQSFVTDYTFGQQVADPNTETFWVDVDQAGGMILLCRIGDPEDVESKYTVKYFLPNEDGTYREEQSAFQHLSSPLLESVSFGYVDPEFADIVWFVTADGLIRYDRSMEVPRDTLYSSYVRKVIAKGDSSVYLGAPEIPDLGLKAGVFTYDLNAFRFEFAAPAYDYAEENRYQTFLEGFDDTWSHWTDEPTKEYTNLSEGNYRFRVRALNAYKNISEEAVFEFTILPPWYRSWWAYLLYALAALASIAFIVYSYNRWRSRVLEARNRELEETIKIRTEEIRQTNQQIRERNQEIREKNTQLEETLDNLKKTQQQLIVQEKLASLGQLTAGIAHEIKNPLNFVNNLAEDSVELTGELREALDRFRQSSDPADYDSLLELLASLEKHARIIHDNGQRADSIVRNMMEHANDNRGERRLTDINGLVEEHVKLAYNGYRMQSNHFNLRIQKDLAAELPSVMVNAQEIGRVILNLVNNACFALEERAKIEGGDYQPVLEVSTGSAGEQVEIRIRDNGIGIPEVIRKDIFNPFFSTKPTSSGNSGLGLSISYDIVTQGHQGELLCESEAGIFTEFVIRLPLSSKT